MPKLIQSTKFLLLPLILLLVYSCGEGPNLPSEPNIEFQSLDIVDVPNSSTDSIILDVFFEDGDADLGLLPSENGRPFHSLDYVFREDPSAQIGFSIIRSSDLNDPEFNAFVPDLQNGVVAEGGGLNINFSNESSNILTSADAPPLFDDLNRFNTLDWQVSTNANLVIALITTGDIISFEEDSPPQGVQGITIDTVRQLEDTVWIQQNRFNRNYFIELLRESSSGSETFDVVDLTEFLGPAGANAFDGRFQFIGNDVGEDIPVEGTITRQFATTALNTLFIIPFLSNSNLRFRISISDRALNESNTVETNTFRPSDFQDE